MIMQEQVVLIGTIPFVGVHGRSHWQGTSRSPDNLDMGRPNQVGLVFGRRILKRAWLSLMLCTSRPLEIRA